MKKSILCGLVFAFFLITGCASQSQRALDLNEINSKGKDPVCSRGCINTYSVCAKGSGETVSRDVQANILTACKNSLKMCIETCEEKK